MGSQVVPGVGGGGAPEELHIGGQDDVLLAAAAAGLHRHLLLPAQLQLQRHQVPEIPRNIIM